MNAKIRKLDHTGDTEFDYDNKDPNSVKVAQDKLTEFLNDCVQQWGICPPVWARRTGQESFEYFDVKSHNLAEVDEVLIHKPIVGG